jgi:Protein of unknown function (DUF3761)
LIGMATLRNIGFSLLAAAALALPANAKAKAKAEVTCTDGSTAKAGRGACSHHGGVADASASTAKPEKAAKSKARAEASESRPAQAEEKKPEEKKSSGGILGGLFGKKSDTAQGRAPATTPRSSTRDAKSGNPTARCKDGTASYSAHHSGTCSGHGGVAEWLDK